MSIKENEKTDNSKVIASVGLTNTSSLNIYEIVHDVEDYVVAGMNDDTPRKYKVYSNTKGSYFKWGGSRYYLDEFIRI